LGNKKPIGGRQERAARRKKSQVENSGMKQTYIRGKETVAEREKGRLIITPSWKATRKMSRSATQAFG